jgi:hypothetical protein
MNYDEYLPQLIDLIDRGASVSTICRELRLKQDITLRRYIRENHPELYAKVVENGKANQKHPAKGRILCKG